MNEEPQEYELDGHIYLIGKLDAITQLHVARRLAPLLAGLKSVSELSLDSALPTILKALAEMPDQDVEYILAKCLAGTKRKIAGAGAVWTPIWNANAKRIQYEDIDLKQMLTLTGQVIMRNLGGFLGELGPTIAAQQPESTVN